MGNPEIGGHHGAAPLTHPQDALSRKHADGLSHYSAADPQLLTQLALRRQMLTHGKVALCDGVMQALHHLLMARLLTRQLRENEGLSHEPPRLLLDDRR